MHPVTERRLRDGELAWGFPHHSVYTKIDMENALDILRRGIVALQSLDDLGSKEANDEAWDKMLVLQQRYDEIMKRYEVVTHTASFDPINDNCPLHPGFMPERMQPPIFDCEFCNEIWDAWKFKGRADRTGRGL